MTAIPLTAGIEGLGLWTAQAPSWAAFRGLLAGATVEEGTRPAPALLPPNQRRRAPDTVLVALEAAQAACAASSATSTVSGARRRSFGGSSAGAGRVPASSAGAPCSTAR